MVTRRSFLSLAAGSTLTGTTWEKHSFPDWSDSFVDKMLTDSPWAKRGGVAFRFRPLFGGTAGGVSTEVYLTTRWSSALPVRQALALCQGGTKPHEIREAEEPEYIVEVAGIPVNMVQRGARHLEAQLADTASLVVKGRKHLVASSVSVPEHGNHLIATMRFPRFENLSAAEGFIEFSAEGASIPFAQKFRLRDMIYRGRLEL